MVIFLFCLIFTIFMQRKFKVHLNISYVKHCIKLTKIFCYHFGVFWNLIIDINFYLRIQKVHFINFELTLDPVILYIYKLISFLANSNVFNFNQFCLFNGLCQRRIKVSQKFILLSVQNFWKILKASVKRNIYGF